MNRKSYLRILKAAFFCALLQIICNFHNIDNELDFIHREMHYKKCLQSDSQESNLTYNFLHRHYNNNNTTATTEDILIIKPIMHTYIRSNCEYTELLKFWMTSWKMQVGKLEY